MEVYKVMEAKRKKHCIKLFILSIILSSSFYFTSTAMAGESDANSEQKVVDLNRGYTLEKFDANGFTDHQLQRYMRVIKAILIEADIPILREEKYEFSSNLLGTRYGNRITIPNVKLPRGKVDMYADGELSDSEYVFKAAVNDFFKQIDCTATIQVIDEFGQDRFVITWRSKQATDINNVSTQPLLEVIDQLKVEIREIKERLDILEK